LALNDRLAPRLGEPDPRLPAEEVKQLLAKIKVRAAAARAPRD
jgi:hypothetical protein